MPRCARLSARLQSSRHHPASSLKPFQIVYKVSGLLSYLFAHSNSGWSDTCKMAVILGRPAFLIDADVIGASFKFLSMVLKSESGTAARLSDAKTKVTPPTRQEPGSKAYNPRRF